MFSLLSFKREDSNKRNDMQPPLRERSATRNKALTAYGFAVFSCLSDCLGNHTLVCSKEPSEFFGAEYGFLGKKDADYSSLILLKFA